jgi:hypothetical protein
LVAEGGWLWPKVWHDEALPNPCKSKADAKQVAMMVGNLFCLDTRHLYKEGQGHDLMQTGNKALAMFSNSSPKYNTVGCHMLVDFWIKQLTL